MGFLYSQKSYIHPVAESYFSRIRAAGGDVIDKISVNNFVEELSQIIDPSCWMCWILGSAFNIGTGSTVYSLGKLGNSPGIIINGSVWSASGIIKSTDAQYISIPFNKNLASSMIGVSTQTAGNLISISLAGISATRLALRRDSSTSSQLDAYNGSSNDGFGQTTVPAGFCFAYGEYNAIRPGLSFGNNGLITATSNAVQTINYTDEIRIGTWGNVTSNGRGTISFALISNISLSTYISSIYGIYKRTIGQGLALP